MALPWDFRPLTVTFGTMTVTNVTFQRWAGNTQVVAGVALDDGYAPLVLSPNVVFNTYVPKDLLADLSDGDRQRSTCLVWSDAYDPLGVAYNVLQTIDQSAHHRADRIVDNDTGLIYVVRIAWPNFRQSKISGAVGVLLDE